VRLKTSRLVVVFLVSILLACLGSSAQQTLGSINGTVTDVTGGVVSSTTVKARNTGTNLEQTTSTKADVHADFLGGSGSNSGLGNQLSSPVRQAVTCFEALSKCDST
jgi:hypothetical protein